MKEVVNDEITAGEKDYSALVSKLKAANVDVIYFGGYHPEAALIVKQSREQGLNAQLLSGDSLNTQEFATLAGDAANGVMFTNAAEARNLPSAKAVVDEFRKDGFEPEGYTLSTYAAIQVYARRLPRPARPIRRRLPRPFAPSPGRRSSASSPSTPRAT